MVPDRTLHRADALKCKKFSFDLKAYLTENTVSLNFYRNHGNGSVTQSLTQKYYILKYKDNVSPSKLFSK